MQYTIKDLNRTGIYSILNLVNGKQYIGSTTKSFIYRWTRHKTLLRNNKHCSKNLQLSWNQYTEQMFEFIIIEFCEPEFCSIKEQHYINILNVCDEEFGYNMCPTAGSWLGYKHSDESKEKVRLARTGKKHSDETKLKMSLTKKGKKFSDETKAKMLLANLNRTYIITDTQGQETITNNLKKFCLNNNLPYVSLLNIANGKTKVSRSGWHCRYK